MANEDRPIPNCVRYGFGQEVGFVELNADGSAIFYLGDTDPLSNGVQMTAQHLPVLKEIVRHLEEAPF